MPEKPPPLVDRIRTSAAYMRGETGCEPFFAYLDSNGRAHELAKAFQNLGVRATVSPYEAFVIVEGKPHS